MDGWASHPRMRGLDCREGRLEVPEGTSLPLGLVLACERQEEWEGVLGLLHRSRRRENPYPTALLRATTSGVATRDFNSLVVKLVVKSGPLGIALRLSPKP